MLGDMQSGDDLELMATCLEHYGWAEYTALLVEDSVVAREEAMAIELEPDQPTQQRLSA